MIDTLLKENPEKITKNQMIKEKDIEKLCLMAKDILREEGNLRNLSAPITVLFLFLVFKREKSPWFLFNLKETKKTGVW